MLPFYSCLEATKRGCRRRLTHEDACACSGVAGLTSQRRCSTAGPGACGTEAKTQPCFKPRIMAGVLRAGPKYVNERNNSSRMKQFHAFSCAWNGTVTLMWLPSLHLETACFYASWTQFRCSCCSTCCGGSTPATHRSASRRREPSRRRFFGDTRSRI